MTFVPVYSTASPEEALVVRSLLESCGIECKVAQESVGRLKRIFSGKLGEQTIFVPEEKASEARGIIASREK